MFLKSLEIHYWAKIRSFIFLLQVVFILSENGAFYVKFAHHKTANSVVATLYLRNNFLTYSEILRGCSS